MTPTKLYKSSERVDDSSSDEDEEQENRDSLSRSPSPASSDPLSSRSSSPAFSDASASSSPTPSPSPKPESYDYEPPSTHELSTSKAKSILPSIRSHHQVFLLRAPSGVSLDKVRIDLERRKVRIGEEEWKLMEESNGDVRLIQPVEDSEKFEFGNVRIEKGWSLVRDVKLPTTNIINRTTETIDASTSEQTPRKEKKRKHDKVAEEENATPKKQGEKSHKHKEKHKDKVREKRKEDKHKEKEKKHKSKHSHSHS